MLDRKFTTSEFLVMSAMGFRKLVFAGTCSTAGPGSLRPPVWPPSASAAPGVASGSTSRQKCTCLGQVPWLLRRGVDYLQFAVSLNECSLSHCV